MNSLPPEFHLRLHDQERDHHTFHQRMRRHAHMRRLDRLDQSQHGATTKSLNKAV